MRLQAARAPRLGGATVAAPATEDDDSQPRRRGGAAMLANQQFVLLLALVALLIFFTAQKSLFLGQGEISNLATDFCTLVLLAVGETFVIISGGIDLSVGSTATISTVLAAKAMTGMVGHDAEPVVLLVGLLVCVGVGTTVGLINAALMNYARLVPFVATLATLGAGAGLALVVSGGAPIGADSAAIAFTQAHLWAFSWPDLIILAVIVVAWLYLHFARFGRYTYAIGSNDFAARAAGINVRRHLTKVYVLSGVLAGLTGMFFYLRLGSGAPTSGSGEELQAIAAVVIGGVSLTGGVGKLTGTVLGAMILTVVTDGLIVTNVNPNWNQVAVAGLIAAAAALQALRPGRLNLRRSADH